HEGRVGPDDEHPPQLLPVRVEEPGRAMEADRRLARAGPALDDERSLRLAGEQAVLVGLDRRHDVAHPTLATPLELLAQEVGGAGALERRAVERLVGGVDEPPPLRAEAAPLR